MKYLQPVEVYWVDSSSITGWESASTRTKESMKTSLLCRSVGMFVKKNKKRIIIALSVAFDKDGYVTQMNHNMIIPMKAVTRIKKL